MKDAGKISHEFAKQLAENVFEQFRANQDAAYRSDFDKTILNESIDFEDVVKRVQGEKGKRKE